MYVAMILITLAATGITLAKIKVVEAIEVEISGRNFRQINLDEIHHFLPQGNKDEILLKVMSISSTNLFSNKTLVPINFELSGI